MSERNIRIETDESSGGELDSAVGAHSGSNWLKSAEIKFTGHVISQSLLGKFQHTYSNDFHALHIQNLSNCCLHK